MLPLCLAHDLRDTPLAISIYALVGRSYLLLHRPIPLSSADIIAYDGGGGLSRGAVKRALDRLCDAGWLIATGQRGQKTSYLPTWGSIGGTARPWDLTVAGLNRPRSVRAVRIPRIVLDIGLGRLTPHQRHPALIERYVTRPVLSLHDVGAYGLLWAGIPRSTPALIQLGLASPSGPLPPPSWSALLARISQRPLFDADPAAPTLSARGLQRAGLRSNPAPAPEETPLFFVPPDMIGGMIPPMIGESIGDMIGRTPDSDRTASAAASAETPAQARCQPAPANQANRTNQAKLSSATVSSSQLRSDRAADVSLEPVAHDTGSSTHTRLPAPPAPTPTEQALCGLGVYPSIARRYRSIPPELITRATTIAQRMPARSSLPATIVQLLREEQDSPGWLRQERPDLFLGPMAHDPLRDQNISDDQSAPEGVDLQTRIYMALCAILEPAIYLYFAPKQIAIDGETIAIEVPDWFSDDERAAVDAALDTAAAQLGLRLGTPEPDLHTAAASAAAAPGRADADNSHAGRPAWIDAEQWSQLHLIARSALAGSHWERDEIVGVSPGITRMLRTQLSGLVARLRQKEGL